MNGRRWREEHRGGMSLIFVQRVVRGHDSKYIFKNYRV